MCDEELDMSRYEYSEAETQRLRAMMGREVTIGMAHSHIEYFGKIGAEYGLSAERVMAIYLRHMAYSAYKVNIDLPKVAESVGDSL
jgi:hypothetical protein